MNNNNIRKLNEPDKVFMLEELEELMEDWQKEFCKQYSYDFNATRAYLAAKPIVKYETASTNGNLLLKRPYIKQYLKFMENSIAKNLNISKTMMIDELKKIALSSLGDLHDTWITRKNFEELDENTKAAIQEISTKTVTQLQFVDGEEVPVRVEYVKLKMYDKRSALNDILKAMGWQEPKKIDLTSGEKRIGSVEVIKPTANDLGLNG
jgi:phage terminase small subunit